MNKKYSKKENLNLKKKILKKINVEEIMESLKKDSKKNSYLKVLWNGKNIEVDLNFEDFEKEIDEIREKLENLKILVENAKEWDKKIKDAAGEYILEDAQYWWEPSADYEDEDMPGLIEDLAEIVGKEEAEKMVNDEELSLEVFKKLIYVNSITLNEDGTFDVSLFDTDELIFSGHIMFVYGNLNGKFSAGDFAG